MIEEGPAAPASPGSPCPAPARIVRGDDRGMPPADATTATARRRMLQLCVRPRGLERIISPAAGTAAGLCGVHPLFPSHLAFAGPQGASRARPSMAASAAAPASVNHPDLGAFVMGWRDNICVVCGAGADECASSIGAAVAPSARAATLSARQHGAAQVHEGVVSGEDVTSGIRGGADEDASYSESEGESIAASSSEDNGDGLGAEGGTSGGSDSATDGGRKTTKSAKPWIGAEHALTRHHVLPYGLRDTTGCTPGRGEGKGERKRGRFGRHKRRLTIGRAVRYSRKAAHATSSGNTAQIQARGGTYVEVKGIRQTVPFTSQAHSYLLQCIEQTESLSRGFHSMQSGAGQPQHEART